MLPIESANLTRYNHDYTKTSIVLHWHSTSHSCDPASSFNRTFFSIPVIYCNVVWGCLIVNLKTCVSHEFLNSMFELVADSFVRAFMKIHPDCNKMKAKTVKLKLAPRPVTV
jgi:hypothetical protein